MRRAAGVFLALALAACEAPHAAPRVGDPAPAYEAVTLDGARPVSLASLRGKPVLLNVWATWCHPCREEMPDLERLHRQRAAAGLQVVGVSIDERGQEHSIQEFLKEMGVSYPIWLDPDDRVSPTFALIGVPGTFLVGRDGTLLWSRMGPLTADDPALARALDQALR